MMWEKTLYIAKRNGKQTDDFGTEVPVYEEPIKYRFNYQPSTSNTDYLAYGTLFNTMFVTYVPSKYIGKLQAGDAVYLIDNQTPNQSALEELLALDSGNDFCDHANYRIKTAVPQNMLLRITFEKVAGTVKGDNENG